MAELSLIENIQREALNPIEEADAYQTLMTHFSLSQEEISGRREGSFHRHQCPEAAQAAEGNPRGPRKEDPVRRSCQGHPLDGLR